MLGGVQSGRCWGGREKKQNNPGMVNGERERGTGHANWESFKKNCQGIETKGLKEGRKYEEDLGFPGE